MPPTSTDQKCHPTHLPLIPSPGSFSTNHDGRPEPFAKLRRRPHLISKRDDLQPRQASFDAEPNAPGLQPSLFSPTTLHASIIPRPMITQAVDGPPTITENSLNKNIPSTGIALIVAGVLFAGLLGLGVFVIQARKPSFFLVCFKRCRRRPKLKNLTSALPSSKKGILIRTGDDSDDSTWGTPTRIIHFKSAFDESHDDRESLGPEPPSLPHERDLLSKLGTLELLSTSGPTIEKVPYQSKETFQERLHIEEEDIASALNVALCDLLASSAVRSSQLPDNATVIEETRCIIEDACPLLVTNEGAISPLESFRDGLDSIGQHAANFGYKNRPRQGSDASASSQETTVAHALDCFSPVNSSGSSMTSIASADIDLDDEDGPESAYELKRAQTQSLEIKKGVLVVWQCTSSSPSHIGMPSKVIISDSCQTDHGNIEGKTGALEAALSQGGGFETMPTVSSLVCENSRGTLASLTPSFSSTTRAEGWCTDEEGFLQPPVPYLMVTRPSTSSIFTTDSTGSSISIDLNDFPHPPSVVRPTYSRLVDQIHGQKRVWDNHPSDSTIAQKRSTVEQFIMMYETG